MKPAHAPAFTFLSQGKAVARCTVFQKVSKDEIVSFTFARLQLCKLRGRRKDR